LTLTTANAAFVDFLEVLLTNPIATNDGSAQTIAANQFIRATSHLRIKNSWTTRRRSNQTIATGAHCRIIGTIADSAYIQLFRTERLATAISA
jgi:hypothetical protein